jgi:hypothetical protein
MGNLHRRCVIVPIHGNHFHAIALKLNDYFFAKLARA